MAPYRGELHLHCYRMLGSLADADDVLQETMIAAWKAIGGFCGRSSLRTWLYRIATNRCLNAIRDAKRRPPPVPAPPFRPPRPSGAYEATWLQPYPDAWLEQPADPQARLEASDTIRLAFVAALQQLAPRQGAALLLYDVLGFALPEVAAMLDATPTAVKGLLQRARAALNALRMTSGYYSDSTHQTAAMIEDERVKVVSENLGDLLRSNAPLDGPAAQRLRAFRAEVSTDPAVLSRRLRSLASSYHLGTLNDCFYDPATAHCGADGPHLGERMCRSTACPNAVETTHHLPGWEALLADQEGLAQAVTHPDLRGRLETDIRETRAQVVRLRRSKDSE